MGPEASYPYIVAAGGDSGKRSDWRMACECHCSGVVCTIGVAGERCGTCVYGVMVAVYGADHVLCRRWSNDWTVAWIN